MSLAYQTIDRGLALAPRLNAELRDAHPSTVIAEALDTFGPRLALVSSFGAESAVLLHLASRIDPTIPVLFLDTGMLFAQTLDYSRQLAAELGLTDVRDLCARASRISPLAIPGPICGKRDTDACCHIRKVLPLDLALEGRSTPGSPDGSASMAGPA